MDRDENDRSQGQGSPSHQTGYDSESNRKGTPQADGDSGSSEPRNTQRQGRSGGTSPQRDEREHLASDPKKKLGQEDDDSHRDDE
jgi:hypothetical protein